MLVPETPEDHGPASKTFKRRRSSRRSTLKTDHVLNRVLETPETALVTSSRGRTRVEESPDDAGSSRGRDSYLIHDPDPSVAPHPPASSRPHPLFSHPRQDPLLESEDTFVQYVAATQDLASTRMEDKVNQWLMQNEEREQNKKSRRSAIKSGKNSGGTRPLANDLCQMLLHKENQSASSPVAESDGASQARLTPPAPTTRKKPNRRRSSLLGPPLDHSLISSLPDTTARRTSFFRSPLTARKVGKDASASLESGLRPSLGPVKALDLQDSSEDEVFIAKAPTPATVAPTTPTPPQVSLSSMASSSSCLAPGVAVPDFSTDSAKALMQHYEDEKLKSESEKVAAEADTEEEEEQQEAGAELPPLDSVLKEVVAYVEVRTKHENRSKGVQDALVSLGAKISPKIGPDVTHFIFKDGSLSAYNKAKKLNIHIVSVTWIEACRKDRTKASESLFPTTSKHKYDSPGLFPKLRKVKSMQPKTDEELAKITDAKSKARIKKAETDKKNSSTTKEKSFARPKPKFPIGQIPLDFYNSPRAHLAKNVSPPKMDKDSIMNVLNEIGSPIHTPKSQRLPNSSIELSPCNSEDFNTPLARRLANKYYQPSSGGTIAPTTPGSQLSKVVPSRRLSEDMSLTLMGPPESPLVRNGTGGLKFKKVTSAANESLLSGIAELEAEQDAEEEEEEERVELDKAKRLHKNKANKTKRSREESSEDKDEVALLAVNGGETTPKVKSRCACSAGYCCCCCLFFVGFGLFLLLVSTIFLKVLLDFQLSFLFFICFLPFLLFSLLSLLFPFFLIPFSNFLTFFSVPFYSRLKRLAALENENPRKRLRLQEKNPAVNNNLHRSPLASTSLIVKSKRQSGVGKKKVARNDQKRRPLGPSGDICSSRKTSTARSQ